jgi:hypothetical protein
MRISIGGEPFSGLDGDGGQMGIGHEIALGAGLDTRLAKDRPLPAPLELKTAKALGPATPLVLLRRAHRVVR